MRRLEIQAVFTAVKPLVLVCVLLMSGLAVQAHEHDHERSAEEQDKLLHDEALFHFHRSEYMRTLVLLENEHVGTNHIDNDYHNRNHLLAVEAALRLGMLNEAEGILKHLGFTARERDIKHQTLYYQGKLSFTRERWNASIKELQEARKLLPPELRHEAAYMLSVAYLKRDLPVEAAKVMATLPKDSLWGAYAYFNLAMHYTERDRSASKALVALRVASTFTDETVEGREINDRINLAAGKIAIDLNDYEKASGFLEDVMAEGTSAPAAIVLYGQALQGLGRNRTAIQTWHRAKKFALMVPGVADAFQAIAYGYEQEELRSTSIDAYSEAISVYEKELLQTRELDEELRNSGLLAMLRKVQIDDSGVEWFLSTDLASNTPRIAFVYLLMSQDDVFVPARTLLEFDEHRSDLRQGLQRLEALESVLKKRLGKAGKGRKPVKLSVDETVLNDLISQRNQMVESFKRLPAGPQKTLAATEIRSLDIELRVLKRRYESVRERLTDTQGFFRRQLEETGKIRQEFERLVAEIDREIKALDESLSATAREELEKHRKQMHNYYIRSQLALVNLYDDIAVSELQKSLDLQKEVIKGAGS